MSPNWPGRYSALRTTGAVFPIGSQLRREVDDALLSVDEDGEYELLVRKWFGGVFPVNESDQF